MQRFCTHQLREHAVSESDGLSGVAELEYEFTFFDMIRQLFFAPLYLFVKLIHTFNQQRPQNHPGLFLGAVAGLRKHHSK